MGAGQTIGNEARELIRKALGHYGGQYSVGRSENLESAWGSLVAKRIFSLKHWIFPTSTTASDFMDYTCQGDDAEPCLGRLGVVSPKRGGSVPNAYAPVHLEHTVALATLLRSGFVYQDLQSPELNAVVDVLAQEFGDSDGTLGPALSPSCGVGDIAQRILLLSMLEPTRIRSDTLEQMIDMRELEEHTRTHANTNYTSYGTICNILLALLQQPNTAQHLPLVIRIAELLCDTWWTTDGTLKDETNMCRLYPYLLLVRAFTDLLSWSSGNEISTTPENNLKPRVRIALFQACLRTMLVQGKDGSWAGSVEATAYGVLILSEARRLGFMDDLKDHIYGAIDKGVSFLKTEKESISPSGHSWNEKLPNTSSFLIQAYKLAAIKMSAHPLTPVDTQYHNKGSEKTAIAQLKLIQRTPLFSEIPSWQIRASFIEATLFRPLLQALRLRTFPRENMEADKYFEIIPFTWTACNNRLHTFASTSLLFEMMVLSFLNYQADEFMEAVAGPEFEGDLNSLRNLVNRLFVDEPQAGNPKVYEPLSRFITYVVGNPAVQSASPWDRQHVKRRLHTFLLAHITQTEDNCRFAGTQIPGIYTEARDTFFHWVRTTSADHTSCPYSFAFISCLISSSLAPGQDCFPTTTQKYLAEAMCWRLATMCRMYNDYGSVERDKIEGNLNSVNFPEFQVNLNTTEATRRSTVAGDSRKNTLLAFAEYEREDLDEIVARLDGEIDTAETSPEFNTLEKRKMAILRMFVDVTDLYGQIYVIRDIASRMKKDTGNGDVVNKEELRRN
ncbi:hypothetical protein F4782DRAFT_137943 [Xylaria castorea]|nr:hypothetical protein F4782DRAFT_137943 [Xylaria castorea]